MSGNERRLAEASSGCCGGSRTAVHGDGDTVVARTDLGHGERVVVAGHRDTVPLGETSHAGSRKVGSTAAERRHEERRRRPRLRLASHLAEPKRDVTYVFYGNEEVEAVKNGLGRMGATTATGWRRLRGADGADQWAPSRAAAREPCGLTSSCAGTGPIAHGPGWAATRSMPPGGVLRRLAATSRQRSTSTAWTTAKASTRSGSPAGLPATIPDECRVPSTTASRRTRARTQAADVVRQVLDGFDVVSGDRRPGALPGLRTPQPRPSSRWSARALPKFGWTDVARFGELGVPAVNYGPGDPSVAHQREENCDIAPIVECEQKMLAWLGA